MNILGIFRDVVAYKLSDGNVTDLMYLFLFAYR